MIIGGSVTLNLSGVSLGPPPVAPLAPVMGNVSYPITNTGNTAIANITITPSCNGGLPVQSYRATSNTGISGTSVGTTITVNGLTKGNAYTFTATATNAQGTSLSSNISATIVPVTVPGAPTIGTATATGSSTANVGFTAPTDTGGNAIISYTATSNTGISSSGTTSPISVTGLSGSTSYIFTVKATNSYGNSAPSANSSAILTCKPTGSQSYVTTGSYTWVAPAGVCRVSVVAIGGGSGGFPASWYCHNCNPCVAGGISYFINNTTVAGYGGTSGGYCVSGGGTYVGDGGGAGGGKGGGAGGYSGTGGRSYCIVGHAGSGGGGGSGGYAPYGCSTGNGYGGGGGTGIHGQSCSGAAGATPSSGGGGGGGGGGSRGGNGGKYAGRANGGGVGGGGYCYGGVSAPAGSNGSSSGGPIATGITTSGGGVGGGGGCIFFGSTQLEGGSGGGGAFGGAGGSAGFSCAYCGFSGGGGGLGYKNNITVVPGNSYTVVVGRGGSGGTRWQCPCNHGYGFYGGAGSGGAGAVRIVWPGDTRQFPSTSVGTP